MPISGAMMSTTQVSTSAILSSASPLNMEAWAGVAFPSAAPAARPNSTGGGNPFPGASAGTLRLRCGLVIGWCGCRSHHDQGSSASHPLADPWASRNRKARVASSSGTASMFAMRTL